MKRTSVNFYIDLLAVAFFVGMIATGYILYFALPPGTNKSFSLWGLTRHQWGQIHFWISVGLLAVLLTHVALHWQWIVAVVTQRLGLEKKLQDRQLLSGVIALLALVAVLAAFAWVTEISVRERQDPPYTADQDPDHLSSTELVAGNPPRKASDVQVDFWEDVYPIFESSCLRCHGPGRTYGDFRVNQREDFFGINGEPAFVIAGNSAESSLIAIVDGLRTDVAMSAAHKLPASEVDTLRAWIDAGAEWPQRRISE